MGAVQVVSGLITLQTQLQLRPVGCGDVNCTALVVQRVLRMMAVLIPAFSNSQLHTRPHVHHRNGQRVQLILTALQQDTRERREKILINI